MFVDPCVELGFSGGSVTTDCPSSPEYCQRNYCQSFQGCLREGDGSATATCGYWVDGWTTVSGEEALVVSELLGCVPTDDFLTP
jgi:hypothetical protein